MRTSVTYLFLILGLMAGCKSKEPIAQAPEAKVPLWVNNRPNNAFKYIGIGVCEKTNGNNYQLEAKKNALYDLCSEIKVNISSNSVLYTVQNNSGFSENFNSLINLSSSENIEGYQLIDSYENEKQYWVYYQLDKQEYANLKAQKRQQIISKASNLINLSFVDEKNKDFTSSLKKRIQAFGLLTPYLSEEINFDVAQNGIKNVVDLTGLIQQQLQLIAVKQQKDILVIKPYQQIYLPLNYQLELNNKNALQNFPFVATTDEENININAKTGTNENGELQIIINRCEALHQTVNFSLSPDISRLMDADSLNKAAVAILRQFIQTPTLKVNARVKDINVYINSKEKNLGKETGLNLIEQIIHQKFTGEEIKLVNTINEADYIIESNATTQKDISSDIFESRCKLKLAVLSISIQLKNSNQEVLYKTQAGEIYGYANDLEKAGMNAYSSSDVLPKLSETLFFLKRKIVAY